MATLLFWLAIAWGLWYGFTVEQAPTPEVATLAVTTFLIGLTALALWHIVVRPRRL